MYLKPVDVIRIYNGFLGSVASGRPIDEFMADLLSGGPISVPLDGGPHFIDLFL